MDSDALFKLALRRAKQLKIDAKEVLDAETLGAYPYRPLSLVEYCLHEAAHLVTLGIQPVDFQRYIKLFCAPNTSLTESLTERFENISSDAGDVLEIDTSIVTYLTGRRLGLWTDSAAIQDSCVKNLGLNARGKVAAAFVSADRDVQVICTGHETADMTARCWHRQSFDLTVWFRGKSRIFG